MTNPVLLNDLRKSWFRRRPVHAAALMAIIILVVTLLVASGGSTLLGLATRDLPFWRIPDILLPVVAPAFTAGAFAKEYEQRTWQDVLLTRLTAGEILTGKFVACFLPSIATIVVLMPPLAMLLIITDVQWAQEPGPWLVVFAGRFLVAIVFYLAVGLVCSYHSNNTRTSLVVGYVTLALYGMVSFFIWRLLAGMWAELVYTGPSYSPYSTYQPNGLLHLSKSQFEISAIDLMYSFQSIVIFVALYGYLYARISNRRADRPVGA